MKKQTSDQLLESSAVPMNGIRVYYRDKVELITRTKVQEILELIEDCKFSQLGKLLEKLKIEHK
jgi:hypothetical protein